MAEESDTTTRMTAMMMMIDEAYEFSAPRFYDFLKGETEDEVRKAELWFDSALSYAPSRTYPSLSLLLLPYNRGFASRFSVFVDLF
jgi:targeting protein for Xklp2